MSSYSKLIIFVLALLVISAAIVLIDSSVDSINKTMPDISSSIVDGDNDYNEAVILLNERSFDESRNKAISAGNNFNDSLKQLQDIQSEFSSDINDVQNEYIGILIRELELKIQAVNKLEDSIDNLEVNSNYTGSNYASEANDLIYEASQYQIQRDTIVKDNPKLFKDNFII